MMRAYGEFFKVKRFFELPRVMPIIDREWDDDEAELEVKQACSASGSLAGYRFPEFLGDRYREPHYSRPKEDLAAIAARREAEKEARRKLDEEEAAYLRKLDERERLIHTVMKFPHGNRAVANAVANQYAYMKKIDHDSIRNMSQIEWLWRKSRAVAGFNCSKEESLALLSAYLAG